MDCDDLLFCSRNRLAARAASVVFLVVVLVVDVELELNTRLLPVGDFAILKPLKYEAWRNEISEENTFRAAAGTCPGEELTVARAGRCRIDPGQHLLQFRLYVGIVNLQQGCITHWQFIPHNMNIVKNPAQTRAIALQ